MIHVAHRSLPKVGETANGDQALARETDSEPSLLAVIDALGHGPEAAVVANNAIEYLNTVSIERSLLDIMYGLHERLAGSRGAAGTVCILRNRALEVCAVGNVEFRCSEIRVPLIFSAGVLGSRVAKFHVCTASVKPRARLVLFSDGVSARTPLDELRSQKPLAACEIIVQKYRRKEDDATVLVADVE